jgi:hypothetical protein
MAERIVPNWLIERDEGGQACRMVLCGYMRVPDRRRARRLRTADDSAVPAQKVPEYVQGTLAFDGAGVPSDH